MLTCTEGLIDRCLLFIRLGECGRDADGKARDSFNSFRKSLV